MADSILLPDSMRPANLNLAPMHKEVDPDTGAVLFLGTKVKYVTSDIFNICNRIREISPRLYLIELEQHSREGQKWGYAVVEQCIDGVDRVVCRVGKRDLDARLLEKLRYIMGVDLNERIAIVERERESWERQYADDAAEELFDTLGGQMHRDLVANGFTGAPFPTSYRPMNRTARRHGRTMR
jgi:hypothetical protein